MPIHEVKGDLLESDCDIIIHCCNCFNAMGAGIARSIANKWPGAWEADNRTIKGDKDKLGTFTYYDSFGDDEVEDIVVFNLYAQYRYGTERRHVNYEALIRGLYLVKEYLQHEDFNGLKIGTYQLGCGLAGGNWNIVRAIIEEVFADRDIYIYTL